MATGIYPYVVLAKVLVTLRWSVTMSYFLLRYIGKIAVLQFVTHRCFYLPINNIWVPLLGYQASDCFLINYSSPHEKNTCQLSSQCFYITSLWYWCLKMKGFGVPKQSMAEKWKSLMIKKSTCFSVPGPEISEDGFSTLLLNPVVYSENFVDWCGLYLDVSRLQKLRENVWFTLETVYKCMDDVIGLECVACTFHWHGMTHLCHCIQSFSD